MSETDVVALEALIPYLQHRGDCGAYSPANNRYTGTCDCGLAVVLRGLRQTPPLETPPQIFTTVSWDGSRDALTAIHAALGSYIRALDDSPDFRIGDSYMKACAALGLPIDMPESVTRPETPMSEPSKFVWWFIVGLAIGAWSVAFADWWTR
jgi:hypothetical protein